MNRVLTVFRWDLMQGLRNRFLQVFALATVMGGTAMLVAAPGRETLPLILIQALLFFGSLFAFLIGWASGQEARDQGAFLFAQPIGVRELVGGKLLGTGAWAILLFVLFMGPATLRVGMLDNLLPLIGLPIGFLVVCLLAGLGIGLLATPVSGLLTVLLTWVVTVAGWELGLLVLSQAPWFEHAPWLFVTLVLMNPAGAFRIGAMIGLDSVPFDTDGLETGRWVFEHIAPVALGIFAIWTVILFLTITRQLTRQEY